MEDIHISTDPPNTATPADATPTGTPPKHPSPIDQARDVAKRVLAMITGHDRN